MQNFNQILNLYYFYAKTFKIDLFSGKKSEIRREAKKIFVLTPSNALKTPLFKQILDLGSSWGGGGAMPPPLRTGLSRAKCPKCDILFH